MDSNEFKYLIERYIADETTPEEIERLRELLKQPEFLAQLELQMDNQLAENAVNKTEFPQVVNRIKKTLLLKIAEEKKVVPMRGRFFKPWMAAAAIFLLLASAGFFWLSNKTAPEHNKTVAVIPKNEVQPGKQGAILTLSDGRTILLDDANNGVIATQNGSKIELNNGQVVYHANGSTDIAYNTMATPRGRQFQLVLPDGTKAWLNAASSLRYPTAFTGSERKVEVTGEVYFEVAKNPEMPFKVKVNDETEVMVLGTHFNINSYKDESLINTTLLEGSVQITSKGQKAILKPGQQAQIVNSSLNSSNTGKQKINVVSDVDLKKVMAWKDGIFNFEDANLHEVMRQLERWYDIDVVYEKGIPDIEFVGTMGRDLSLSDVLKGLHLSDVHFRLDGRKLIVMP